MSEFNQSNRNLILSCYATFLAQGNTLLCRSIKAKTIREYLNAACLFSEQAGLPNPKIDIYRLKKTHPIIYRAIYNRRILDKNPFENIYNGLHVFILRKRPF